MRESTMTMPGVSLMAKTRQALGRGLSALIPETGPPTTVTNNEVDIAQLTPNRHQPRMEVEAANRALIIIQFVIALVRADDKPMLFS